MRKNVTHFLSLLFGVLYSTVTFSQVHYKQMMNDPNYNFYEVCEAAEIYFTTHEKGKGSGWKPYQRWKSENESKYYPSGIRNNVSSRFVAERYALFLDQVHTNSRSRSASWKELGPWDANNITRGYNPGIGRVESFWINPANTDHIFLGSRSGGFWRSTNAGGNWENTTDTLVASGVNTVAVNPFNADTVLINVKNAANNTTHGIYQSVDGGGNWTESNFNPTNLGWGGMGTNDRIFKIIYHPRIPNLIFIGTNRGIFRSDDHLQTWTQLRSTADITDIEFHPTNDSIIYIYDNYYWSATKDNILISHDQGLSYTVSSTITGNNSRKGFIAVSPVAPDFVYFASDNGVWKSADMGQNFDLVSVPTESCDGFAVSDIDTLNMVYGYLNLMGSTDGGQTFVEIAAWANSNPTDDYTHADLRTAECLNGTFYVGTDGYLAKTDDNGATWARLNDGTAIREFYNAGVCQGNKNVFMAGSQDNGTSVKNENGWIEWNGGDGMEALVHSLNSDWMMGSWQYGTRQVTKDGGQTRQGVSNPEAGSGDWIAPMFYDPLHQMRIYSFADSIWQSDDFGDSWYLTGTPNIGTIQNAAIANNNSQIMIMSKGSSIRITEDGGQTYRSPGLGLPMSWSPTDFAFDPNHDSTIVVTYNRYQPDNAKVFITHDLGYSWSNISYNLNDMPIRSVVIDHTSDRTIYLGAEIGVYAMPMNSTSWSEFGAGLPNVAVNDLEIHEGSNTLNAITWGRGLWEVSLLNRAPYPAIETTNITNAPSTTRPRSGYDENVTITISHNQPLKSVFVKWNKDTLGLLRNIPMSNVSDSTWVTDIPFKHFPEGTEMYFKVFAVGQNNDTTETYRFHYTIRQGIPVASVIENSFDSQVHLFPNPNDGKFNVDLGNDYGKVEVRVFDVAGKQVFAKQVSGNLFPVDLKAPAGVYFITLSNENKKAKIKFVID